jgi:hypothetical protein
LDKQRREFSMPKKSNVPAKPGAKVKKPKAGAGKAKSAADSGPGDSQAQDAIALLEADHRAVKLLFEEYESAAGDARKRALANAICVALKVHARLEEDLFYPAAARAVDDRGLLEEAEVEHASARDLIAQIESGAPGEALFDARVKVLGEYIDHHVAEEEGEIFPQCRAAGLDLAALGEAMALRRQELLVGFTVSNPVLALS